MNNTNQPNAASPSSLRDDLCVGKSANRERVMRHERAFAGTRQLLLVFDAKLLLSDLADEVYLSPINSGNARRRAVPRSSKLFVPYKMWITDGWPEIGGKKRLISSSPVEIVIKGRLPLYPYLIHVEENNQFAKDITDYMLGGSILRKAPAQEVQSRL